MDSAITKVRRRFEFVSSLSASLLTVGKGGKWGIYSTDEDRLVVPLEFDLIIHFRDGIYRVKQGEKWGLFSISKGGLVVPVEFEEIHPMGNGNNWRLSSGDRTAIFSDGVIRDVDSTGRPLSSGKPLFI